jgi:hypothetical protein
MMHDIVLGGVYMPALLLLGVVALVATGLLSRLINLAGGYRFIVYRPLVDLALFVLVLGLLVLLAARRGIGA